LEILFLQRAFLDFVDAVSQLGISKNFIHIEINILLGEGPQNTKILEVMECAKDGRFGNAVSYPDKN
jgi:hypothetical protein